MDRNHERRVSDAASIRPPNFAMFGNDIVSRKSSAATTTTIMPETTIPHFSTAQRVESQRRPRPSSSGSVATDDLKRSLKRGESTGAMSTTSTDSRSQSSRWGSVISGLWSTRRRDSTTYSTYSGYDPKSPVKASFHRTDKLSQMVEEATLVDDVDVPPTSTRPATDTLRGTGTPRECKGHSREPSIRPDRTPDPTGAFESPVKTSINADDGVIDVDISFPDYMTTFESAISSPSSSGYLSTPGQNGLESFEQASRLCIDGDLPLNAAGWLNRYHPDFALQAIPLRRTLLSRSKHLSKPSPPHLLHTQSWAISTSVG
ncbi:hypothetical protein NXS19_013394 [Fusarium pseudograminearum]|nr:hypothetical protein NXS19_013394 [Fusarium pseudograminearum]